MMAKLLTVSSVTLGYTGRATDDELHAIVQLQRHRWVVREL